MSRRGFTLIELLVVVTIIVVLLAMLVPAMGKALETSSRVSCAAELHQISVSCLSYATDNDRLLPTGKRDGDHYEHTPWISEETHKALMGYTLQTDILHCPNYVGGFGYNQPSSGWVIGYNYIASHPNCTAVQGWANPVRATDPTNLPLISDYNNWSPPDGWTFVSHTAGGAAGTAATGYYNYLGGLTPLQVGSEGGNLCLLDGSAAWKPLSKMVQYESAETGVNRYPAMW